MTALCFHVGDASQTQCKIAYSTLVDSPVSLTVTGIAPANITDSGRTDQHGTVFIGTGYFTITGLSAFTKYTFMISQGSETYSGSFWTMPSSQNEPYSFIMHTCTYYKDVGPLSFRDMRHVAEEYESTAPVVYLFDIDDVMYTDNLHATNNIDLPNQTNQPQFSGLASDYAVGWAIWHGHESRYQNFQDPDALWTHWNIASGKTGGDHAIEGNHCRGVVGNSDYSGCDRTLEATAIGVWNAFIGDANPQMLGISGTYWGKEIGPVRFAAIDEFSFSDPADGTNFYESRTTHPMLGDQQITDIQNYLDVNTIPFKTMCMSTGFSIAGQPWSELWRDESRYFHANVLNSPNLNGTNGWFFGMVGDNHTLHAQQLSEGTGTGFWSFCPGTTGSSTSVTGSGNSLDEFGTKQGHTAYFRSTDIGKPIGGMQYGAFLHVIVHADETPKRVQVRAIETGGNVVFDYSLTAVSGNDNQWENNWKMRLGL